MSWTHFLTWLGAAYALYYGLNLTFDHLKSPMKSLGSEDHDAVLFYAAEEPVLVSDEVVDPFAAESPVSTDSSSEYLSSGQTGSNAAVNLHEIQELARQELIEYKKKIPY